MCFWTLRNISFGFLFSGRFSIGVHVPYCSNETLSICLYLHEEKHWSNEHRQLYLPIRRHSDVCRCKWLVLYLYSVWKGIPSRTVSTVHPVAVGFSTGKSIMPTHSKSDAIKSERTFLIDHRCIWISTGRIIHIRQMFVLRDSTHRVPAPQSSTLHVLSVNAQWKKNESLQWISLINKNHLFSLLADGPPTSHQSE